MSDKKIFLEKCPSKPLSGKVRISSSKSESNRLLLINALAAEKMQLENLSTARDTQTMNRLLETKPEEWDVLDAGTTMRFLTAYLSIKSAGAVITGTDRMKQRPIAPLVDALCLLGASVQYQEKEGFPPLKISHVVNQQSNQISIPGNISSQYISALLMIAPCLPKGLTIELTTEIFSRPYIEMTLKLMEMYGVSHQWMANVIKIPSQSYRAKNQSYSVESDWSGASYWYSFVALAPEGSELFLPGLRGNSTQGDQAISKIMSQMGVISSFESDGVRLRKSPISKSEIKLNFRECPDLAQTVMVVAAVKGIPLEMTGLESLKIKETDRVAAMRNELAKIGAQLQENENDWRLIPTSSLPSSVTIETYEDHRMAMAFAPLCQLMDVTVLDPDVVNKSYPEYWEEVNSLT